MPTPSTSEMISDLAQWTKALDAGHRIISLHESLSKNVEAVVSVAKKADEIDPKIYIERELQQSMEDICEAGEEVQAVSRTLAGREEELTGILKQARNCKLADTSTVEDCIKKLDIILELAGKFSNLIVKFQKKIKAAKQVCEILRQKHEKEKQRLQDEAAKKKSAGIVGATACGVGAVALGIAGFFTFGTTWVGVAALGAAAGAANGAVAIGAMTYIDLKKLGEQVDKLQKIIGELDEQLKGLESLPEKLQMDAKVLGDIKESIHYVLDLYQEKQEQFEREQKLREENQMMKQREAENEEKMRKLMEENEMLKKKQAS